MARTLELMLLRTVEKLGEPGDVVKVRSGYARNYLLPRKLAAPVSADTVRQASSARKRVEEEKALKVEAAKALAERIGEHSVHVEVKANAEGHLFGSVTAAMISEALAADSLEVEAGRVHLEAPIKELGIYEVPIKLFGDVETTVKVYVVAPPPPEGAPPIELPEPTEPEE